MPPPLVCFDGGTDIVVVGKAGGHNVKITTASWPAPSAGDVQTLVEAGKAHFDALQTLRGPSPALLQCSQQLWRALRTASPTSPAVQAWKVLEIQLLMGHDAPPRKDFVAWAFGEEPVTAEDADVKLLLMGRGVAAAERCAQRVKRRGDADFVASVRAVVQLLEHMPGQGAGEPHASEWLRWRSRVKEAKTAHAELQRADSELGRLCRIMEGDVGELMAALDAVFPAQAGWQHLLACLLLFQAPTTQRHQVAALAGECARWKADARPSVLAALRGDAAAAMYLLRVETMDAWVDCHLAEVLSRAGALSTAAVAGFSPRLLAIGHYALLWLAAEHSLALAVHYLDHAGEAPKMATQWMLRCVDAAKHDTDADVGRSVDFCLADARLTAAGRALCMRRAEYWRTRALANALPWAQAAGELDAFERSLVSTMTSIEDAEKAVDELGAALRLLPESCFLARFGAMHRTLLQAAAAMQADDATWAALRDRAVGEAALAVSPAPAALRVGVCRKALLFGVDRPKTPPTVSVGACFKFMRVVENAPHQHGAAVDDLRAVLLQALASGVANGRF